MLLTLGALHRVCCIVHVLSATALLLVLATGDHAWSAYKRPVSRSFMTPSQWHYMCWSNATKAYTKVYYCKQEHKQWYVKLPESHGQFDWMFQTATAAVYFSYFSGFCHFVAMLSNRVTFPATLLDRVFYVLSSLNPCKEHGRFKTLNEVNYQHEIFIRAVDYVATAPVMLALFSVLWNANNVVGVLVAPFALAVVILVAFKVSYDVCASAPSPSWHVTWKYSVFFFLSAIFFTFLGLGPINAIISQSERNGEVPRGVSQYPPGIIAASSFVLLTFSSFVYPYFLELQYKNTKDIARLASMWAAMSLVSKIILLAAFGAGAQVQTDMLMEIDNDAPQPPGATSFDVDTVTIAVASSIVLVGIVFFVVVQRWLTSVTTKRYNSLVETFKLYSNDENQ